MKLLGMRILHLFPACLSLTRFVVYSIFFLETVNTASIGADLYYWFAADFGNILNLNTLLAPFSELQVSSSGVSLSVHLFFAYRILVLYEKRSRWLCVIICLVVFFSFKKAENGFIILLIAIHCRRIWGSRSRCHGEAAPLHIHRTCLKHMQLQQIYKFYNIG